MRLPIALLPAAVVAVAVPATAIETPGLNAVLENLEHQGKFSGAVVIRDSDGVRFARSYGWADPFKKRAFTVTTPVDSGSLAKPVTSAGVLLLASEGKIDLDRRVQHYLPEFPHASTTVRQLLSHSAGLVLDDTATFLANKDNLELVTTAGAPKFPPGTAFRYCNLCSITLALVIERVSGLPYLRFARERLQLPSSVTLRPARLSDWTGRAIGYRRKADGTLVRFDSWEGEKFYGAANLSVAATDLALWGSQWWDKRLRSIREIATAPAAIGNAKSGLSLGNWYCAPSRRQCHYLGHHEGFHNMLYWDADRRISIAMVSNNGLSPMLQQRLQRAIRAFAENRPDAASREIASPLADLHVPVGKFRLASGEVIGVLPGDGIDTVRRAGIDYEAYPVAAGVKYVPGLDVYLAGAPGGGVHWLSLYEDSKGEPVAN